MEGDHEMDGPLSEDGGHGGAHDVNEHNDTDTRTLPTPPSFQDEATDAFRSQLTAVVDAYLDAKKALVTDDAEGARAGLAAMDDALSEVERNELDGDAHDAWMQDLNALQSHLAHVNHLEGRSDLRREFGTLSRILAYSVEQFGVEGVLYVQYCPMAFDGEGAHWLSRSEEIQNPYVPGMRSCGEVTKTLE
jgi:Cu(I)/Ag(I) efflux system membrane fusion protein